jgi:maleylpyruvate isomerase
LKLTLHSYWRSSCSWRVRIALSHKGLAYDYVPVHLVRSGGEQHGPDFAAKSPLEQVPYLEVEENGRRFGLVQSLAILEWLEEIRPEPPLLPRDAVAGGTARQLAEVVNAGIQPLQNLSVLQAIKEIPGAHAKDWARRWIAHGLGALERVAARTSGDYLVGDAPTFADLCLVPQLYNARRFAVELSPYPTLLRVEARCEMLPAFQAAHPDRQPDAEPDANP